MRRLPGSLAILVILAMVACATTSWADKKPQQLKDRPGWDDQLDRPAGEQPPGWDQGKKTGWRGQDSPPGQEKKAHRRSHKKYRDDDWRRDTPRSGSAPVPMPVPIPIPR